jgi:hypothetical protein
LAAKFRAVKAVKAEWLLNSLGQHGRFTAKFERFPESATALPIAQKDFASQSAERIETPMKDKMNPENPVHPYIII